MMDYAIHDIDSAEQGRLEIMLAENEMPGLMALRAKYAAEQPLKGARIAGCLHMTVQTAVLIETLVDLGAEVRWSGCNTLSTQDNAASAVVVGRDGTPDEPMGVPVFAWKDQTDEEYWWCIRQTFGSDGRWPNLLVDDGGDATLYAHQTAGVADGIRGVSEETTTGVARLNKMWDEGELRFPAIDVNASVTKHKFDNLYGCRHSLIDGLNRATDRMIGGQLAVVCGYGDVGKGCADALRSQGARVVVTEIDPICALQAAMDGYQVANLDTVVSKADIIITATGCVDVVTGWHLRQMKHLAIVGNIGHFDSEIAVENLRCIQTSETEIKPQVTMHELPTGQSIILLSDGKLMNLGNATGHPSFIMSCSFSNQVLAQMHLHDPARDLWSCVYELPREMDEEVAQLHLDALGVELTRLTHQQAKYLGVQMNGPYKRKNYRY